MTTAPARQYVNPGTPSRMVDRLREGAAVIYVEGIYDPRNPVPTPTWIDGSPALGGGITTYRDSGSHRVTLSTVVLVDPLMYQRVMRLQPKLHFCRDDKGRYTFSHPDTDGGQGRQWVPAVQLPQGTPTVAGRPSIQGIWHVVLNLSPFEPHTCMYLNGDRFDLRAANLRLVDA
jgi:hypothetical protein